MARLLPILLLLADCATLSNSTLGGAARAPFEVKVVGHGPPMVLIPGLASPGEVWADVVAHYQDRYTCHVLTLAGFAGTSPLSNEALLPAVHDGLVRYLREQHLNAPVIVGHSLGGYLGLWVASTDPELVGRLIIVDSVPSLALLQAPGMSELEVKQQADETRSQLRMATPADRAKYARLTGKLMATDPAKAELVASWSMKSDPDTVADAYYFIMTHDLREAISTVRAPTLVIGTWAASHAYVNRQTMLERFTSQYQRCTTCSVSLNDKARHFVMFDDLAGLLAQVDGFLTSSTATAAAGQKAL